jgi:protein O-GlcNAc transferase
MGVLGHRPAPIQAHYLGFPGTTGADFVDYLIGDATVTPLEHAGNFTEKIAQLDGCYQPNDGHRPLPAAAPRSAYGLPDEGFVYCCFNQTYKILPRVFERWCSILRAVPGSVLWLYSATERSSANLKREARSRGVDPSRLHFAPFVSRDDHLARLRCADLFLDTFPCNAHTTASDALWVGLPLLTCIGETFASRVAASLLRAVDLPELVTPSLDEYEKLAVALASDRPQLARLRTRLESSRASARLFDARRCARELEALYERMVGRWRMGLPPAHLAARSSGSSRDAATSG